jgi:hypothetical protein
MVRTARETADVMRVQQAFDIALEITQPRAQAGDAGIAHVSLIDLAVPADGVGRA